MVLRWGSTPHKGTIFINLILTIMNWKVLLVFMAVFAMAVYRPLTIAYVVAVWSLCVLIGIYLLIDFLRHGKG